MTSRVDVARIFPRRVHQAKGGPVVQGLMVSKGAPLAIDLGPHFASSEAQPGNGILIVAPDTLKELSWLQ